MKLTAVPRAEAVPAVHVHAANEWVRYVSETAPAGSANIGVAEPELAANAALELPVGPQLYKTVPEVPMSGEDGG